MVFRNDEISLEELISLHPTQLVISPGPGNPENDSGVSLEAIRFFNGRIPLLGICLGHQCLGALYGARVERAARIMHGKSSVVYHTGSGILAGVPSPFEAMRYHSLLVFEPFSPELEIIAYTPEMEIMGIRHRQFPTFGLQFHPESILTQHGKIILKNFLRTKNFQDKSTRFPGPPTALPKV